jgi:predicted lipid-binding transport protein (Tim44 family)
LISVTPSGTTTPTNSHPLAQVFGIISAAIGSVLSVIGIGYIVMFYGLLKGKRWAWTMTIILLLIGIAIQVISTTTGSVFNASIIHNNANANSVISGIVGGIIGIAINVVIMWLTKLTYYTTWSLYSKTTT